jgi:intermembrane space import and assembly protein 40
MPHGPCGEQFRKAFSCFVYSEAEPKGQDCIDAFGEMQDCFRYPPYQHVDNRAHPDVYKPFDALEEDELDDTSAEALETATKKGDEQLESHDEEKPKKDAEKKESKKAKEEPKKAQGKNEKQTHTEKHDNIAKEGDERKNEDHVARAG